MTLGTATLDMPTGYKILAPQMELTYLNVQPLTIHRDFIYVVMMCERMGVKISSQTSVQAVWWAGTAPMKRQFQPLLKTGAGLTNTATSML